MGITTGHSQYRLYSSFVDVALNGFKGGQWLQLVAGAALARSAFEAEIERWVDRAFTKPAGMVSSKRSSKSSNANASSNTSASNTSSAVPTSGARSCLAHLYHMMLSRFDARPPSFVRLPGAASTSADSMNASASSWTGGVLLSGGDRNAAMSDRLVENHVAFAQRHGYGYWWHRGSLVASHSWQPYWHKIAMLRIAARERFPNASSWAWIDDDIVLTNHAAQDMLRAALRRTDASIIVTRDPAVATATLNTGIMIVRNNEAGRAALEAGPPVSA